MSKKILNVLLSIMLMMTVFTACGNKVSNDTKDQTTNEQKPTEAPKEQKKVELEFWTISLKPTFDNYINDLCSKFTAKNPNITIKWLDVPIGEIEKKILTAATAGSMPDVVNLNIEFINKLAELGVMQNMDEALTKDQKGQYFESVWKGSSYKNGVYALPWYLSTNVIAFNTELYKKAGLDPEKPPKNIDEIVKDSYTIKEKTGKFGYTPSSYPIWFLQNGCEMVDAEKKVGKFNTPEGLKAMNLLKEMFDKDVISREVLMDTKKPVDMYTSGESAYYITGPSLLKSIKDNAPDIYKATSVAPDILSSKGERHVSIMNIAVPKASKNKDDAIKFALHVTSSQSMLDFSKLAAILPSTKESLKDPYFSLMPKDGDAMEKGRIISAQQLPQATNLMPIVKNIANINKELKSTVQKVLLGEITAEKGLQNLDQIAASAMKD